MPSPSIAEQGGSEISRSRRGPFLDSKPIPAKAVTLPPRRYPRNVPATPSISPIAVNGDTLQNGFFAALTRKALAAIKSMSCPVSYPAGASIFIEGEASLGIYVLCRGQVKLLTGGANGETVILRIAEPGEILALDSTILDSPYQLTAETLLPVAAIFIARSDFLTFLKQHGRACLHATTQLSRDCRSTYDKIRLIGLSNSAQEKLARFLIHYAANAQSNHGVIQLELALTHQEVAQIIGASRETVTRLLASFKKQHIAILHASMLSIQDKPALERIAAL